MQDRGQKLVDELPDPALPIPHGVPAEIVEIWPHQLQKKAFPEIGSFSCDIESCEFASEERSREFRDAWNSRAT